MVAGFSPMNEAAVDIEHEYHDEYQPLIHVQYIDQILLESELRALYRLVSAPLAFYR